MGPEAVDQGADIRRGKVRRGDDRADGLVILGHFQPVVLVGFGGPGLDQHGALGAHAAKGLTHLFRTEVLEMRTARRPVLVREPPEVRFVNQPEMMMGVDDHRRGPPGVWLAPLIGITLIRNETG